MQQQYDVLPPSLVLRELRYAVRRRGFRSRSVTLVTMLTTPERYPAGELAGQYLDRLEIEVRRSGRRRRRIASASSTRCAGCALHATSMNRSS